MSVAINTFLSNLREFLPYIILSLFVIGGIESYNLIRAEGKIKRGYRLWSKPLPDGALEYLSGLSREIVEPPIKIGFSKISSFIRVENGEAVISYRKPGWRTSWPYVGYVDLTALEPKLEYRIALTLHILVLALTYIIPFIPFFVLMMGINFYVETRAIEAYVKGKINQ